MSKSNQKRFNQITAVITIALIVLSVSAVYQLGQPIIDLNYQVEGYNGAEVSLKITLDELEKYKTTSPE